MIDSGLGLQFFHVATISGRVPVFMKPFFGNGARSINFHAEGVSEYSR
jgi:hypothetical protein